MTCDSFARFNVELKPARTFTFTCFNMPAFQFLPVNKRKYDDDELDAEVSRKRISTNSLTQTGRENENEVWMVQWY